LKNKVLVVGVTNDPVTPYPDALATYNMMGSNNANFMTHDGFGHCTVSDPNNCTWSNLIGYFINGIPSPYFSRQYLPLSKYPDTGADFKELSPPMEQPV
jgi:hypothetical protein